MQTKMTILYMIVAGIAVYFLLPLFLLLLPKIQTRHHSCGRSIICSRLGSFVMLRVLSG